MWSTSVALDLMRRNEDGMNWSVDRKILWREGGFRICINNEIILTV